jgi:hypothetical protein
MLWHHGVHDIQAFTAHVTADAHKLTFRNLMCAVMHSCELHALDMLYVRLQVLYRNRFVRRTLDFAGARRRARREARRSTQPLGFMITNFNALSHESATALEMTLDWLYSFDKVAKRPASLLAQLLEGAALTKEIC